MILSVIAIGGLLARKPAPAINSFEDCAKAGYSILESYPAQCKTPDGRIFSQDIGNELEKQDLIRVRAPRPNQKVKSPMVIEGEARGTWFFEASFPIKLVDKDGNLIALAIAQAQADWMTESFVPFRTKMEYSLATSTPATLILEKDNPSGLPQHADELRIPLLLEP